jgi:hypothetical protein
LLRNEKSITTEIPQIGSLLVDLYFEKFGCIETPMT